ncbi:MAG: hypothetical protein H0W86_04020 [Armatimonadetes bacterium]|nr:hypothetical protein [Armatimonadota bacterium]
MPENPHEYTLRKQWENQEDIDGVAIFIRENGYVLNFRGRDYTCFDVDGYRHWTMGSPVTKQALSTAH